MKQRAGFLRINGFTLVELIAVMVIIGILAVIALPSFFDRQIFDTHAFGEQVKSMVRYAQKIAIAQNRNVFVRLNGASIAVCFDNGCTDQVESPAANSGSAATLAACANSTTWLCEAIPSGIAFAAAPAVASFYFSPLGVPYLPADPYPTSNFPAAGVNTLVITMNGGGVIRTTSIERETGYVR